MGLFYGSMSHSFSGRKKKKLSRGRKTTPVFKAYVPSTTYRRETPDYPSVESTVSATVAKVEDYKKEVSRKYTIAPAYNKGAYQVIPLENVKDIGR